MNIIVIGKSGQLAQAIKSLEPSVICLGREEINLFDSDGLSMVLDAFEPDALINASAYTAVDKAESDEQAAYDLNSGAVKNLVDYAKKNNIHVTHVSTDYVFTGDKGSPYLSEDECAPVGVYGKSKYCGEQHILNTIPNKSNILRTSWVYSSYGNNFVKTMLRLMKEKPELGVIDDQIGTPTSALSLANACLCSAKKAINGIHHFTDAGVASWYDFACAIQEMAIARNMLVHEIPINPIPTSAYPTPAKRPSYSVLSKLSFKNAFQDIHVRHWRVELAKVLDTIADASPE